MGDIGVLVPARRRDGRGDVLVAEGRCEHCGVAVDLRFSLSDYASHRRPRRPRGVTPAEEAGWWRLNRHEISFRVPLASDVVTIMSSPRPRAELLARCVRGSVNVLAARAVERAMAAIAPTLWADVAGSCPECGSSVPHDLDLREPCLLALRFLSASVYDHVNLIASVYHWAENAILSLESP